MNRKFPLIIGVLLAVGFGVYGYLGGFNQVKIVSTTSKPTFVAGKYFAGGMKDKAFGNYFQEAAKLLEEKKIAGHLGNIYYNNPEETHDSIRAFVGVIVADSLVKLPPGYELRKWEGGQPVLQASVNAHFFLSPGKLYPGLFEHAKQNNLKLKKQYLEEFLDNRHGQVQAQLQEK